MVEDIEVYLRGRQSPIVIYGADYHGHTIPNGAKTKNWHYYVDKDGNEYHFRKTEIQYVFVKSERRV